MFKRKGQAKLSGGLEFGDSIDVQTLNHLTRYDLDAKYIGKDFSTNRSQSKFSTTMEKTSLADFTTTRGSPHILTTLQSSRSNVGEEMGLPPILTQNSPKGKNMNRDFYYGKNMRSYHGSISMPSVVIGDFIYDKLKLNMEDDFTSVPFLRRFKRLFPKQIGDKEKLTMSKGGAKKSFTVKRARQVIDYLVDELRYLIKPKISQGMSRKSTTLDEQYNMVEDLDSAVIEMIKLCDRAFNEIKVKNSLDKTFKDMLELAQQTNNLELILYSIYMRAKISVARSETKEAIFYFRQYKTLCVSYKLFKNKLSAYKNLGKCYQFLRKHKTALMYFTKFLQMAWHLNSEKHELVAYDYIGKQYYYLGIRDKAIYFHDKMSLAKIEPKSSAWRQIGVYKITQDQKADFHFSKLSLLGGSTTEADSEELAENQNRDHDESVEMTSREEVVELAIPPENKKKLDENKNTMDDKKKEKSTKKMDKFINGLMKAQIIKNQEHKQVPKHKLREKHKDYQIKTEPDFERPNEVKVVFKSPTRPDAHPDEKILISHLSRNRNLYNFSLLIGRDFENIVHQDSQVTLGSTSVEKVRVLIEKFKVNLILIKQSLEICNSGHENSLFPILSRRPTEY